MIKRRKFIKIFIGGTASAMMPIPMAQAFQGQTKKDKWGELLPLHTLGKTGKKVTMLGLGGFHIGKMNDKEAGKTIETAISGGIRFFDTAESYQSGGSEEKLGRLLTPRYRDEIFLMTKSKARDGKTAKEHLEGSLRRLKTDYLDLWLIHSVNSVDDVHNRLDKGVLDVFKQAKESGKVRHIGFSGHVTPEAHAEMIELANTMETCQMPINLLDINYQSFIKNILPKLLNKDIGVLAMKTLAGGGFFGGGFEGRYGEKEKVTDHVSITDALHFVWSLPVDILITGPDNAEMLQEKIEIAKKFTRLNEKEKEKLIKKVAHMAGTRIEYYKS